MDIQRTRTAPETGTGRQFDTMQRHQTTAVADKTQLRARSFNPEDHRGVYEGGVCGGGFKNLALSSLCGAMPLKLQIVPQVARLRSSAAPCYARKLFSRTRRTKHTPVAKKDNKFGQIVPEASGYL